MGTYFNEILIKIEHFSLKKMYLKMSSAKYCSFCLSLTVLTLFSVSNICDAITEFLTKFTLSHVCGMIITDFTHISGITSLVLDQSYVPVPVKQLWRVCYRSNRLDRLISQSHNAFAQISHNAPFCNRNVHTHAHFCYKMVHCGIRDWCIVGFVQHVYTNNIITAKWSITKT